MKRTELFLGILIGALCMYFLIHFLWRVGYYALYAAIAFIRRTDRPSHGNTLSSLEPMVLPQILRDDPDFDLDGEKEKIRRELESRYGDRLGFEIPGIVLSSYRCSGTSKTVGFEALLRWQEKKNVEQKLEIFLKQAEPAHVCPGCGTEWSGDASFCTNCGRKLPERCPADWNISRIRERS